MTRWRFPDTDAKDKKKEELSKEDAESLTNFIKGLFKLADLWNSTSWLALIIKVVLWGLLISLVALVIWRYREWLSTFVGSIGLPQRKRREAPLQLFGLEVAPETLPDDVASEAERLWAEHPREALGLLYRALLSHLLHDFRLPLRAPTPKARYLAWCRGCSVTSCPASPRSSPVTGRTSPTATSCRRRASSAASARAGAG